jgi:anaerobic magnesium-protoporphyrin IX monomethyl ester cyclase
MKVLIVVYDNASYISWFPQGAAAIAAALRGAGHEVDIFSQDINHDSPEGLTFFLNATNFDAVCIGACGGYWQHQKLIELSRAVRAAQRRVPLILGCHGPSSDPEYFMRLTDADAVVVGEGEDALNELLGRQCISGVVRHAVRADVDSLPPPAYDLFDIGYYRLIRAPRCEPTDFCLPMLSGRGCPYRCTFCYRIDPGFRPRSPAAIVNEMYLLRNAYGITYFMFSDELLMSSETRTLAVCDAIVSSGLRCKWSCQGRLNFARPDVLAAMRVAGCVYINYGVEALDDGVLAAMDKRLTVAEIEAGVAHTLESGISPGLNVIWGNLGDTRETLQRGVDFLLKHDDGAQLRTIRPVTPYPGSQLFTTAVSRGMLRDTEDFYRRHVNSDLLTVNFTAETDADFHALLRAANAKLVRNYYHRQCANTLRAAERLYSGDASFRGFRTT